MRVLLLNAKKHWPQLGKQSLCCSITLRKLGPDQRQNHPQTTVCSLQTALPQETVVQVKTKRAHAPSLRLHPALLAEGERRGDIGEGLLGQIPAAALSPPRHRVPPSVLHLALQKDKRFITSVQRAVHVPHAPHAQCPAPHLGTTGCLTQGVADQGPDLGPPLGPDHHLRGFAEGGGEMFTAAESPGGNMRSGLRNLKP